MIGNTLTIFAIAICLTGCSGAKQSDGSNSASSMTVPTQMSSAPAATPKQSETIARCMSDSSKPDMKLKLMGEPAVYVRKGDFDGNGIDDVAVLVVSDSEPMKGGLVVCRNGDSKQSSVFGALFKPKPAVTTFDEDNFITSEWDVVLKTESQKLALGPDGKSRIGNRNKGDVISFFHEGGAVFIYWDGSEFRIVEGG